MKKLLLIATLLSTPVMADEDQKSLEEMCAAKEEVAAALMIARQKNVPAVKLMKAVKPELKTIMMSLIHRAYQVPAYSGQRYQNEAIAEFRSEVYLDCLMND